MSLFSNCRVLTAATDPTIEDTYLKQIEYKDNSYVLEIIDTAGTEQVSVER